MFKDLTKYSRMRFKAMALGIVIFVLTYLLSDPDLGLVTQLPFGTAVLSVLIPLTRAVLYFSALHLSRKALFDYMDLEQIMRRAATSSTGAGMVAIAMGLYYIAGAMIIMSAVSG